MYASTANPVTGSQVWRTLDGVQWTRVEAGGFGDPANLLIEIGAVHAGWLYAGTVNFTGGQLWRTADGASWERVGTPGLGDPQRYSLSPAARYGSELLVGAIDFAAGGRILRSLDGETFVPVTAPGFGDAGNGGVHPLGVVGGRLLAGTANPVTGGELWSWDLAPLGASLCQGSPNSAGAGATLTAMGDPSVSTNCVRLSVEGCPPGSPGLFVLGPFQNDVPFGDGRLCVGAPFYRVLPRVTADADGSAGFFLDLADGHYGDGISLGGRPTHYQFLYVDTGTGGALNASEAVAIVHTP